MCSVYFFIFFAKAEIHGSVWLYIVCVCRWYNKHVCVLILMPTTSYKYIFKSTSARFVHGICVSPKEAKQFFDCAIHLRALFQTQTHNLCTVSNTNSFNDESSRLTKLLLRITQFFKPLHIIRNFTPRSHHTLNRIEKYCCVCARVSLFLCVWVSICKENYCYY